jgi:spore coat polysaccharide biosynthesis protein SpsF
MEIIGILQARCSSTRLPGKVLRPIMGKPMLLQQIERLQRSKHLSKIVVATSDAPDDDPLASLCLSHKIECYRGDLNDVLDRFYQAAVKYNAPHIARLTGDCPLTDPAVIDHVIEAYTEAGVDYASNALEPSYPDGLDVEIFNIATLKQAWEKAQLPSEREHVTPYIHKHPDHFKLLSVKHTEDLSALRWTVDNPEDFAFVSRVYEALYLQNPKFNTTDILHLISSDPDMVSVNSHIVRNEGYQLSVSKDHTNGADRNV